MTFKPDRLEYGIYTIGDENFFPGILAAINALRYYNYKGQIAVFDLGFLPWMQDYFNQLEGVNVLPIEPINKLIRFTDVKSDEQPVMTGWAYKAFGILYYDLFQSWTFIDADYLPLCNLEEELLPLIRKGHFVSTEDGTNHWDERHQEAIGVEPGSYMNINAGFISLDMQVHAPLIHEWRNLMTRRKPFDLWYGDQGALNAVLDKNGVHKYTLDKVLWNQTWLNESMAKEGACELVQNGKEVYAYYPPQEERIMGWHGMGWHKLWHQIGIDHYRKDNAEERKRFFLESQGKSPKAIVDIFKYFLFLDNDNPPLSQEEHLLIPKPGRKVFIDCGVREGDGIAAFLGDEQVGYGAYFKCLKSRSDAHEFEFIGFESPDFRFKETTRERFAHVPFHLHEQLVWTYDGKVLFDSDGESMDCRLLEVSRTEDKDPWRHPNPKAVVMELPCIDLANFIRENFLPSDYLILKVDIEGAEYDVLDHLIQDNLLSWFNEMYIEYHWWGTVSLRESIEKAIRAQPHIHYRNDWP